VTATGPGPAYLEQAAAELDKARADNDKRREIAAEAATNNPALAAKILDDVSDRGMEIAEDFIRMAAVERGLPLCCHGAQPEPEPQP
jgi:hypothetical protein